MHTPLKAATWSQVLVAHPDKAFARYLLAGITEGFRIGFRYGSPLTSSSANMASAIQHPEVFEEYLSKELSLGRMLGPFPSSMNLPYLQVNRVGIIPKGYNTGKWRLITDLSFPLNQSVNDGIDPSLCSLSYITVEDVAAVVAHLGVGTLLVKVDIESAYVGWSQSTPRTALSKQCGGRTSYMSIPCYHLAYDPLPKFLMQWQMLSTGT